MSHPFVDIVIPVHNAPGELLACLASLQGKTTDYRVILVDDFSDETASSISRTFVQQNPTTLLVRTGKQKWFSRASNIGLRLVRTERSILLNSDCTVDDGWVEELFACWDDAAKQQRVGLVGSVLSAEEPRRWSQVLPPGYVTGHCWLLSISALSEVSAARGMPGWYLDEQRQDAIHIRSDVYLSWDLNKLGYATIASYKSAVGHPGGRSWNYDLGKISQLRVQDLE